MSLSSISLNLTEASGEVLNSPNQVDFTYNLIDIDQTRRVELGAFGAEVSADLSVGLAIDYYASLTLPATELDFSLQIKDAAVVDEVVFIGDLVTVQTAGFEFTTTTLETSLDIDTLAFTTGFDVNASASISDILLDTAISSPLTFDGASIAYAENFELLGFALAPNDDGEHFASDIDAIGNFLNDNVPVDAIMQGNYAVPGLPIDLSWNFNNIGFEAPEEIHDLASDGSADFSILNGSGESFASATLDLDDLLSQFILPTGGNPLLSPFEFNWSSTFFEDTWFETNFEVMATLLDLDLEFGVELVQQTEFVQSSATVTAYEDGTEVASAALGQELSFAGLDAVGTQNYDLQYAVSGDVVTSWGFQFYFDVPVELLSFEIWEGELGFAVDEHGFTVPDIPDDAFGFTVYDRTFRIAQSGFFAIPGATSTTAVELLSDLHEFEVVFTDDEWVADVSSDAATPVENPYNLPVGANKISGTSEAESLSGGDGAELICGLGGNDHLNGGDGNDTLDGGAGADTLIGGAGDDVFLSRYNYVEVIEGGEGDDWAHIGFVDGSTQVYTSRYHQSYQFFDADGTQLMSLGSRAFRDVQAESTGNILTVLAFLPEVLETGSIGIGDTQDTYNDVSTPNAPDVTISGVEHINIDESGTTPSGFTSLGLYFYMGGDTYISAANGHFAADWSAQGTALDWDISREAITTLANGVTVGNMNRLTVLLGTDNDDVTGGSGADYIDGGDGNDTLDGGEGADTLIGGAGDDFLNGNTGSDKISGGSGEDTLAGGLGLDTYYFEAGFENDVLLDPDGGRLDFAGFDVNDIQLSRYDSTLVICFEGSDDTVKILNYFALRSSDWQFLFNGVTESIDTSHLTDPWDDFNRSVTRYGDEDQQRWALLDGGEYVFAFGGNDIIQPGEGADLIDGGDGIDVLSFREDSIGVELDFINGTGIGGRSNGDIFRNIEGALGTDFSDTMSGDQGPNYFNGLAGNDSLFGRGGDDLLNGDAGDDTLDGGLGDDVLNGGAGGDSLLGGDGHDSLLGADQNDTLNGQAGDDTLEGGAGNDSLLGEAGMDVMSGGVGSDVMDGGDDADMLSGDLGNDSLLGGGGDDTLDGGFSQDLLDGGDGDDRLIGGYGDDTLIGGAGIDTAVYSGFGGNITVNLNVTAAQYTGAAGTETLSGIENLIGGAFSDRLLGRTDNSLLEGGDSSDTLLGLGGDDTIDGQTGNDQLLGGSGDDELLGGTGFDALLGGTGADTLRGGDGNDQLRGGDGGDTLMGGMGRDILIGGDYVAGGFPGDGAADTFVFTDVTESQIGLGRDIIRDFEQGTDLLDMSAIDADVALAGDQAFAFIGSARFSGAAGEIRALNTVASTLVFADVDGDKVADFHLILNGLMSLSDTDFVL